MISLTTLPDSAGWERSADEVSSFRGPSRFAELGGPARLVRLLSSVTGGGGARRSPEGESVMANRVDGKFWLAAEDFERMRARARAEIAAQARGGGFRASREQLASLHLRMQLREGLAVSRDWAFGDFGKYVVLSVPAGARLVVLVGTVEAQPVYSGDRPDLAEVARGMKLAGGLTQYVIRFDFPANAAAHGWLGAPVTF